MSRDDMPSLILVTMQIMLLCIYIYLIWSVSSQHCLAYVGVKYREGGMYAIYSPQAEDAQRPRAVYDIHPDFRGI